MREAHAQDAVAVLEDREVGRHVRLRARVGLDVHELGTREEGQRALLGEALHDVHVLAAAVVALARLAFGVLVGEPGAVGLEDRAGGVVLARDELDLPGLPLALADHRRPQLGVDDGDGLARPATVEGDAHSCSAASSARGPVYPRVPRAPAASRARRPVAGAQSPTRAASMAALARAPSRSRRVAPVRSTATTLEGTPPRTGPSSRTRASEGAELLDELVRGVCLGLAGAVRGADRERTELAGEGAWHAHDRAPARPACRGRRSEAPEASAHARAAARASGGPARSARPAGAPTGVRTTASATWSRSSMRSGMPLSGGRCLAATSASSASRRGQHARCRRRSRWAGPRCRRAASAAAALGRAPPGSGRGQPGGARPVRHRAARAGRPGAAPRGRGGCGRSSGAAARRRPPPAGPPGRRRSRGARRRRGPPHRAAPGSSRRDDGQPVGPPSSATAARSWPPRAAPGWRPRGRRAGSPRAGRPGSGEGTASRRSPTREGEEVGQRHGETALIGRHLEGVARDVADVEAHGVAVATTAQLDARAPRGWRRSRCPRPRRGTAARRRCRAARRSGRHGCARAPGPRASRSRAAG